MAAMSASVFVKPGQLQPQLASGSSRRAPQLLHIHGISAGRGLGGRHKQDSFRQFYGQRPALRRTPGSLMVLRTYGIRASFGKAQNASESGEELKNAKPGEEVLSRFPETAQSTIQSTPLHPVASLLLGLALGAAFFCASRGQDLLKRRAVPCFASASIAVSENSATEKKKSEPASTGAVPEAIKSAQSEENAESPAESEIMSSEQLHTEAEVPALSVRSVMTSPPEQEVGDSLQGSARGSQDYLESRVEFVSEKQEAEPVVSEIQAQDNEVTESTTKAEEEDENDRDDEDDDDDDDDEEADEYKEIDETRIVRLDDIAAGGGDVGGGTTTVDTNQRGESGSGVQDDDNEFPEDQEELRRAYEEWKAKPYALTVPLKIVGLRSSVPPAWLKDFLQTQGKKVKLAVEFQGSLKSILAGLAEAVEKQQINAKSIMAADLVTIGDSWLGTAVAGGLVEPIENAEQHEWYHRLGPRWQKLLRRNNDGLLDAKGKIWGVPYRWGTLVIAYRTDKFKKFHVPAIKDWGDLFGPDLEEKIAMVDSPREVVGLVLKSLGNSFNTNDFEKDVKGGRQAVKDRFVALQKQVRLFDSVQYLKALGAGDVWVAVGWSSDVIPFAKRTSNIEVVVPASGTSLWADLWAVPATCAIKSEKAGGRVRGPSPLVQQWLDFCVQPARAVSFQQDVFVGASPLALPPAETQAEDESSVRAMAGSTTDSVPDLSEVQASGTEVPNGRSVRDDDVAFLEAPEILPMEVGLKADPNTLQSAVPENVLAKSEFLEPLSDTAVTDFQWLLEDVVEVSGWPSDLVEFFKGVLQNFQKWIWSRGIRY